MFRDTDFSSWNYFHGNPTYYIKVCTIVRLQISPRQVVPKSFRFIRLHLLFLPAFYIYSNCTPWIKNSSNELDPYFKTRKELSDLYLYIYAYQICFDLMIRTQCMFFVSAVVDQKLTSSWALNWIWHEIRMLAEFFDKKISGFQIPPFLSTLLSGRVNSRRFGG